MRAKTAYSRAFLASFIVLTLMHLLLVSSSRLYPFTDLPNHLAAATIHRYHGEQGNQFDEYYSIALYPKPNIFHILFCGAGVFPSVETANRIYLGVYCILLPLSVLLVIGRLGGNPWLSLFSFLLLYNYNLSWGFVGFTFSIPLVLLFVYFTMEYLHGNGAAGRIMTALLLVLLFFVHALAALFSLLFLAVCLIRERQVSIAGRLGRSLVAVPLLVLVVIWWRAESAAYGGPGLADFLSSYYMNDFLGTFADRKSLFYLDNLHLAGGGRGTAAGAVFALCILVPSLIILLRDTIRGAHHGSGVKGVAHSLLISSIVCFLVLPREIPQQSILYQRFSVFVLLSLTIAAGAAAGKSIRKAGAAGILAACLLHFALQAEYLADFNRANGSFDASFFPTPRHGETLAGIVYDYKYRGAPVYIHFPAYYTVWRKGIASTKIPDYRFGAVRRKAGGRYLPRYLEWVGRFHNYDGRYFRMDFLLSRGNPDPRVRADMKDFAVMKTAGEWRLYERVKKEND